MSLSAVREERSLAGRQGQPPPTGGKIPTRSPPSSRDESSAFVPSMKINLAFSDGRLSRLSRSWTVMPEDMGYVSPSAGMNIRRFA